MQKVVFALVLLAIIAATFAHDDPEHPQPPKPGASIDNTGRLARAILNHRVARQLPDKMPSLEEIKQMGQEMISKLPASVQEAIHKAQEMSQRMMAGQL